MSLYHLNRRQAQSLGCTRNVTAKSTAKAAGAKTTEADEPARPEQTFFEDPAIDRAFGVVMALATEVYVLRDRVRALETLLTERGVIEAGALDAEPDPKTLAHNAADRDAFVANLMENLLGRQASKGAH